MHLASIAAGQAGGHIPTAMVWPHSLVFASDATLLALAGGALLVLALIALVADWRRARRKRIDAVGWVPWTFVFLVCAICGIGLLTMAIQGWARP